MTMSPVQSHHTNALGNLCYRAGYGPEPMAATEIVCKWEPSSLTQVCSAWTAICIRQMSTVPGKSTCPPRSLTTHFGPSSQSSSARRHYVSSCSCSSARVSKLVNPYVPGALALERRHRPRSGKETLPSDRKIRAYNLPDRNHQLA